MVFTTSGDLAERDLSLLADDRQFFAYDHPAAVVRAETARQHPGLVDLFDTLAGHLTQDAIIDMNRQVDIDGDPPDQVAADWVRRVLPQSTP